MHYPPTRTEDVSDTLAGVSFRDPYRWLESRTEEVRCWQQAQAKLAGDYVREWPHFDQLRALVEKFSTERYVLLPRYAAGKWFRSSVAPGASQARAIVSDSPMGEGRVLFDPVVENPERPPFLSWVSPSPDGRTLALGVCADGSESNTIRLVDVATGKPLAGAPTHTLMDNWLGGVQWLPNSSGFFFSAITGPAIDFVQKVYLHLLGSTAATSLVEVEWTQGTEWRMVVVSSDGRHAVAVERLRNPIPVAVASVEGGVLRWRPFVRSVTGTVAGHIVGDRYVAVTDVGAPRGRLVAIALDAEDPNDPSRWVELVSESEAALRSVTPVGDSLYLTEFVDTYTRVRIVDSEGKPCGEVPLPGRGTVSELPFPIMNLLPRGHPDEFLFAFSTLTVSWGFYLHEPGEDGVRTVQEPRVCLADAVVEDCWATSKDGTRIPYHIVRSAKASALEPQPTLVHGYGAFNVPWPPQFPGPSAAFVAAGGVFVLAHLRGGAEFGLDWWRGGRLRNKQNCYYDLYAVAEDLIARKRTSPQKLAFVGASNGGLLAGVAATQRPELWKVVIPRIPHLDLIGQCRDAYGRMLIATEWADIEDPAEVRRLATISPYHLIKEGVRYPAMYMDAGDTDPRCPPWHARKFAARLQQATSGDAPILLHVWENVGHGWATDKNIMVTQNTEWLAFTMRHLGLGDL